ncbi:MAG: DUF6512 family protein [Lachnospiraceae bacterium]|nr:DUF6512 family protein [Lachnospiraceae bacterium]
MRLNLKLVLSFVFVCTLGVLLHFTYDWADQNPIIGFFSAKNESTWEHLKLIFFPFLFLTLYQSLRYKEFAKRQLPGRTLGVLSGMLFIVVVFYCFWGISGRLIDFVNIAIYFGGVIFAFGVEKKMSEKKTSLDISTCVVIWISFTILFFLFSVHTPNLGLFYDPSNHPKSLPTTPDTLRVH